MQGCADRFTDDSYVCAYLRCEGGGEIALYLAAPGPNVPDRTELDIDGKRFIVAMVEAPETGLPYVKRARAMPTGLRETLKTGRTLRVTNAGFAKGFDVIRLTNARQAIRRLEGGCIGKGRLGSALDREAPTMPMSALRQAIDVRKWRFFGAASQS